MEISDLWWITITLPLGTFLLWKYDTFRHAKKKKKKVFEECFDGWCIAKFHTEHYLFENPGMENCPEFQEILRIEMDCYSRLIKIHADRFSRSKHMHYELSRMSLITQTHA